MKRISGGTIICAAATYCFLPLLIVFSGCKPEEVTEMEPPDVVDHVDLHRYLGKWYEIAAIPTSFEKDCYCSSAEYSILKENVIRVINRCRKGGVNGKMKSVKGKAFIVPDSNGAKLKVQFFWPFKGDYWIIDLDDDAYQYAVVGHPQRKYLWILCRTPQMDDSLYKELLSRIQEKGYNTDLIKPMVQAANLSH